ncbi:MAG: IclR family transcriptional regulator [Methyloligellaceae bacterium]
MTIQQGTSERGSALEKAIRVLEKLASSERPTGLAELTAEIDLPRQTIHRILQQLVETGLIIRAPQKDRYVIGPAMTRLSALALASLNIRPPVRAILDQLATETEETCNIGVLDQDEIVYIERVEGTSPLRLQLQVGSRVPVHCTAMGKLLVAEQHKNVRTRILKATHLRRFTGETLTDAASLEKEFANIRSNGYSFNNEEYVEGLTAIAVPISDLHGKAIAALAVHAPSTRMDLHKALTYLPSMNEKAQKIAEAWALTQDSDAPRSNARPARAEQLSKTE